jgi:hypothetical protein
MSEFRTALVNLLIRGRPPPMTTTTLIADAPEKYKSDAGMAFKQTHPRRADLQQI